MPRPQTLLKAQLREITWDNQQQAQETGRNISVQFNPETLKVSYANQSAGGDQRGGSTIQFVGQGTTKLTFDLWFDVTAPQPDGTEETDVRRLTKQVVDFIQPKPSGEQDKFVPPGVRFLWGTFLFDGIMDSINETLEYFSEEGKPLRASIQVALSKQAIQFEFGNQQSPGLGSNPTPGRRPLERARDGDSMQSMLGRKGQQDKWQSVAAANDIDNARRIAPGTPIDMRA